MEQDERVMSIVAMALRQDPAGRESYLRLACQGDPALYGEVAETVAWEARMGSFLQQPMIDFQQFIRPFEAGQLIAQRFEIIREIGEGGMGVVYEAFDQKRNHRIAIKSAKPGFHRLLSPELEGALQVRHPNICLVNEIHTAQTDHGEVDFLTMELLEGKTLAEYLSARAPLGHEEALAIAGQLCSGLAEAHRSGILHRDLKSANVILCATENGGHRAVITDFGLAGGMGVESGELAGTPAYMAPELWQGGRASQASDMYALGVILYEMVTGRLPFKGDSVENPLAGRPPAPRTFVKGLDPRWDRVILACLAASPAERPPDPAEIIARLEKKPVRKLYWAVAVALVLAGFLPPVRHPIVDLFAPVNVRFAVLPVEGSTDSADVTGGTLQDVTDRIRQFRSGRGTVAVISPNEAQQNGVQTGKQAKQVLHATHALQLSVRREGDEFVAQGTVIDLDTEVHMRDFSGRYTLADRGNIPGAVAGEVSLALRLEGGAAEVLSADATVPYDRALYILRQSGESAEPAVAAFLEAARLDPRSPLPLAGVAEAEVKKFQATKDESALEAARLALHSAESLNPDSVRVRLAAGLLNETTGQYLKALEDYRRVQDLEPHNIDALLRTAAVYGEVNMADKAVDAYQKAIQLDPAYYVPYKFLGLYYYYHGGKYGEAGDQFKKAIEHAPGAFDAWADLGAALMDQGKYPEAEQALLKSLELEKTAPALNNLGAVRAYQLRDADAVSYYEGAVNIAPHDFVYVENLADSERRLGRRGDAAADYRKAMTLALEELKQNPQQGYARGFVAYIAARLGDAKRAESEIGQAMQSAPGDNKVIRSAVLTYEALGQRSQAIRALEGATAEVLEELSRQPDLADFCKDPRFQQLVTNPRNGG